MIGESSRDLWSATGDFFFDVLKIPKEHLEENMVENIRRIPPQGVVVYFRDVTTRDMIQSYAPNLADAGGRAGLRLEVPCHLTGQFKCLERCGQLLKSKEGSNFKWHINYDDINLSLCLSVKGAGDESWVRVGVEEAKKELRMAERPAGFRARLTSSTTSSLSAGDSNGEELLEIVQPGGSGGPGSYDIPRSQTLEKYRDKQAKKWGSQQH